MTDGARQYERQVGTVVNVERSGCGQAADVGAQQKNIYNEVGVGC